MNARMKAGEQLDKKIAIYTLSLVFVGAVLAFGASSYALSQADQSPWNQFAGHGEKVLIALGCEPDEMDTTELPTPGAA